MSLLAARSGFAGGGGRLRAKREGVLGDGGAPLCDEPASPLLLARPSVSVVLLPRSHEPPPPNFLKKLGRVSSDLDVEVLPLLAFCQQLARITEGMKGAAFFFNPLNAPLAAPDTRKKREIDARRRRSGREEKREEPVLLLPKLEFTHPHHHYPSPLRRGWIWSE